MGGWTTDRIPNNKIPTDLSKLTLESVTDDIDASCKQMIWNYNAVTF